MTSMSDETPKKEGAQENSNPDVLRHLHEFHQKAYWESTKLLAQGMAFYVAITTALLGYVLTQPLSQVVKRSLIVAGLAISVLFFLGFSVWAFGLLQQINILECLTRDLDPQLYKKARMRALFKRWRSVNKIVMTVI